MKSFLFFLAFFFLTHHSKIFAQVISVDETKSATDLVKILTNNSDCLTISNESVSGDTYTLGKKSYGYFSNQNINFPFKEGIILNTWSARNAIGPYDESQGGGDNRWTGDRDLQTSLGLPNNSTKNATVLEFDFKPLTDNISFNYLFASNEYRSNFPCNYSDGFAFLIKEVGTSTYTNLAVIPNPLQPGQTIPVSSKTIHPKIEDSKDVFGNTNSGCPAQNENYFDRLNTTTSNSPINYTGQTKVMRAFTTVVPNRTYHIKLVIADNTVANYDSAIFINAGSFDSNLNLGSDRLIATNNAICYGESFVIDTHSSSNYSYKWFKNGILIPNETSSTYTATTSGTYEVLLSINGDNCPIPGKIKLEYTQEIRLTSNVENNICDEDNNPFDGITTINFSENGYPKTNLPGDVTLAYYSNENDAINQTNALPLQYKNTVAFSQSFYCRIQNNGSNCFKIASFIININTFKTTDDFNNKTVYICEGNFTTLTAPKGYNGYVWALKKNNGAESVIGGGLTLDTIQVNQEGVFSVNIKNQKCFKTIFYNVIYSQLPIINDVNIVDFSGNQNSASIIYNGVGDYEFSIDGGINYQTSPLFTGLSAGNYVATILEKNNCGGEVITFPFSIIDYLKFFSPNGDGFNDIWKIDFGIKSEIYKVIIYDRYGKVIKELNENSNTWDGSYGADKVPADDYWFKIVFKNGRIIQNHFTLIR